MRLSIALLIAILLSPSVIADETFIVYAERSGTFLVGLNGAAAVDGVNAATFVVTPEENFTRLRFSLDFTEGLAADTPVAEAELLYRMRIDLFDNATFLGSLDYRAPGTFSATLEPERPITVVVSLVQGANVDWTLRVSALRDPTPL